MPAVRRTGIGFVLAVLLSMFLVLAAQAQTDTSGGTSSTVPTLTIVSSSATAMEGDEVTYTVTAGSAPSSALPVVVHVRAHGEVMDTRTVAEVFLPAGATTVTLRLEEFTDEIDESPVNVTLTLAGGTGYSVGDPSEATVSIDYPSISDAQATPTPAPAVSPPDAPSGVSVSAPTINSFTVSWTAETGKSYRVEREAAYLFSYGVWQTIADNQSSGSVTESGLPCGTYYVYRVRGKGVDSSYGASKLVLGPAQSCTSAKGSGTRDVRAPDTEVRKLRLVTDLPTQTSIRIRLLFHRKMDETDLTYTPVSGMKKYRVDRTQRLAPLTVPLPIHWPKPTLESGYRMEQYVSEFDWTGLHCGSNYFFRALGHGNGADFLHDWGNHWSNAVHGSTRGCTKPQVDVIPLPQRKARLRWNNINGASSYEVRVAKPGEAMGNKVPQGCNASYAATGSATAYQCDILLDNIVDNEGLAHVSAGEGYRIRVTVHFTDTSLASQYSDVILLDSPIRSVNGDSRHVPENKGKMVVKWRPAVSISTAHYTVRWRKLRGRHAGQVFWSPISWIEGDRNSEYDWQVGATTTADSATYESENLKRGEIYAVQLNYTLGADQYYSAREAYVWVSARAGGVYGGGVYGELIGGMPLGRALDDILAPDYRTYFYRICEDTINPVSQRSDWAVLIEAALEEWELATDGMVVMTLDGYTAAEVASNPNLDATKVGKSKPCAQYTQVINDIRVEVEIELAATTEETVSREIIERVVSNLHYHADFLNEDLRYNEIIMYDDRPTANAPVEFSELGGVHRLFLVREGSTDVCLYTGSGLVSAES